MYLFLLLLNKLNKFYFIYFNVFLAFLHIAFAQSSRCLFYTESPFICPLFINMYIILESILLTYDKKFENTHLKFTKVKLTKPWNSRDAKQTATAIINHAPLAADVIRIGCRRIN